MSDAMIILPRTDSEEELHEAILDELEHCCDQAQALAQELRITPGVHRVDGPRLARTMRRSATMIREAIDTHELDTDAASSLLGIIHPQIVEAERLVIGADVRLAVDDATWEAIDESVSAIGHLALVGFASYLVDADLTQLLPIEREAPMPLMHAMQRLVAQGYVSARTHAARPAWLEHELTVTLGESLDGVDLGERVHAHVSEFTRIGTVACGQLAARWLARRPTHIVERIARERVDACERVEEMLSFQRDRLDQLPDLLHSWIVGFGYGLIEPLLVDIAERQDVVFTRTVHAALWFDLLMTSDDKVRA